MTVQHKLKLMNFVHDSAEVVYVCGARLTKETMKGVGISVNQNGVGWLVDTKEVTCERCLLKIEVELI